MILLGTCAHRAGGEDGRRMRDAARWNAALPGVACVNVQWPHDAVDLPGLETVRALRRDGARVTGRCGPPKPVVADVVDVLAGIAAGRGWRRIVFVNSDVRVTPALVARIHAGDEEALAVSRTDVTAAGEPVGVVTAGTDALVLDVAWWRRNRRRFADYLMGEPVWDNVFTALIMRYARAAVLNDGPWLLHEQHPAQRWTASPYAEYTRWLAALDRHHFHRWARYHAGLTRLRASGAGPGAERALAAAIFGRPRSVAGALLQPARVLRATLRYALRG